MSTADDTPLPIPDIAVQQHLFTLVSPKASSQQKATAKDALLSAVRKDKMAPYYTFLFTIPELADSNILQKDESLLTELQAANEADLKAFEDEEKKNQEEEGEMEVTAVKRKRAFYLAQIGDKERSLAELKTLSASPSVGVGSRIDLAMAQIRVGLFFGDAKVAAESIEQARALIEKGGDWDRRNRLKVYEGLHLLSIRDFKAGGKLFSDALPTFTATELISFHDFVGLTVLSNLLRLGWEGKRVELRKQIIDSSEVLQVIDDLPHLKALANSLYNAEYGAFFKALAEVEQHHLIPSRLLFPHAQFYVREMRIIAYSQLLESYRSLTLDSMAREFGVKKDFIDSDLARFIAAGRLPAVIDRVQGVVETRRPDSKNAQYAKVIKEGDIVLNSLQKLSRTVL
ncbi:unnamed protein product [Parajaminaea phylloscopi]